MTKLSIRNIGAIKKIDLDLSKINVIIGPQSSGKSTISKILCHCMWVEKSCYYNDKKMKEFSKNEFFFDSLVKYHRLDGYFNKAASFKYTGDFLTIKYTHSTKNIKISVNPKVDYSFPKIAYIPSERNLVATIPNISKYNEKNDVITYFGYDWTEARGVVSELSLNNIFDKEIEYNYRDGVDYIKDGKVPLKLQNASSGILSSIPLYLVSKYLYSALYNKIRVLSPQYLKKINELSYSYKELINESHSKNIFKEDFLFFISSLISLDKKKRTNVSNDTIYNEINKNRNKEIVNESNNVYEKIEKLFEYNHTHIFIEEPEQNLFPKAQSQLVNELFLMLYDSLHEHSAVITTHSPYIIFAINNCIMRSIVQDNISDKYKSSLLNKKAIINPSDISIYQIENGELKNIQDSDGNLDENFINDAYEENSQEYFSLLNFYEDGK